MKKTIISLLLIIAIFNITGCSSKKEQKKEPIQKIDETLVKINNLEFHLNKKSSFNGLNYTITEDFKEANHDKYIQYNYLQEDSTNLLYFRIFYYNGQDNNAAIKDLGLDSNITLTDGKTDNIEYKFYEKPRDDGGTIHFYFINKDNNTYTINFISKYDIKDFEEKVMKSVNF